VEQVSASVLFNLTFDMRFVCSHELCDANNATGFAATQGLFDQAVDEFRLCSWDI
jgi:hypothetical protein